MGASTADDDLLDGRAADKAGLCGPHVDFVLELEEATHTVGVDVVGDGGAAEFDGVLENVAQRFAEQ